MDIIEIVKPPYKVQCKVANFHSVKFHNQTAVLRVTKHGRGRRATFEQRVVREIPVKKMGGTVGQVAAFVLAAGAGLVDAEAEFRTLEKVQDYFEVFLVVTGWEAVDRKVADAFMDVAAYERQKKMNQAQALKLEQEARKLRS